MSGGFSAAVKLGDLDDFLTPAVDCVVLPSQPSTQATKGSVIKSKPSESPDAVAAITLSDCLACSGCVTSAETLLLQSQSVEELLSKRDASVEFHFTISSASRRAFSSSLGIPPTAVCDYLSERLSRILAPSHAVVTDVSIVEAIVIQETVIESESSSTTILTSHCPGWTCYATKILDQSVLSRLSTVKSAEQVMGLVIKHLVPALRMQCVFNSFWVPQIPSVEKRLRHVRTISSHTVYHVYVSPCFDKKLEVIRPDYSIGEGVRAVDLVLASTELLDLLGREPTEPVVVESGRGDVDIYELLGMRNTWAASQTGVESGGYAEAAALRSHNTTEWKQGKNSDLLEFKAFVRSNGFRNIQNIARRVKTGKLDHIQLVEVMACPGGCPRGGGQPLSQNPTKPDPSATLLDRLKSFASQLLTPTQPVMIDSSAVDTVCAPQEYRPAVMLRRSLVRLLGSEAAFQSFVRTEWKSLAEQNEQKPSVTNLRW